MISCRSDSSEQFRNSGYAANPIEQVVLTVYDDEAGAQVDGIMAETFPSLEAMTFTADGGYLQKNYRLSDSEIEAVQEYAVRQALETLRNRVDQFGVSEPDIRSAAEAVAPSGPLAK